MRAKKPDKAVALTKQEVPESNEAISIRTPIDDLFGYIEHFSPVRESMMPFDIKRREDFKRHIDLLEKSGFIDIRTSMFSNERTFIFKRRSRVFVPETKEI